MRILFSSGSSIPPIFYGGIGRIVAGLINELRSRDHLVGLIAHADSNQQVDAFFSWPKKRSSRSWLDKIRNAVALQKAMRSFRPDVIHSFSCVDDLLLSLFHRLPKIMSYQLDPPLRMVNLSQRLSRGSLLFTSCSEYLAARGRQGGGLWYAILNFIDPKKWTFVPEVPEDAPLVFLSRLDRCKGCHTAIAIAKATGRRLLIAGNLRSTLDYWNQEIKPHLGKNGIEYIGEVNDQQKNFLLGSAAALVVPVEWDEPFGIVFAEALACGTPVVCCPRGGIPEFIEDGVHGFYMNSIEEGIKAIAKLRTISRKTCREHAEQRLAVNTAVDQYVKLYDWVINSNTNNFLLKSKSLALHL